MEKIRIGYVGKPFPDFYRWLIQAGYEVVSFVELDSAYVAQEGVTEVYRLDFSDKEAFLTELQKVSPKPIAAFVAVYENAIVPKAWLGEWFKLTALSEKAAYMATDKILMRTQFQKMCPEATPGFQTVETWQDVELFVATHSFPLILKPANLFKSLLVTKNTSVEQLRENFEKTKQHIQAIYDKEFVKRSPQLLLEEYLDGPSYSLEVFADAEGNTVSTKQPVDLVMGRDMGIEDNFNYSRVLPSKLSQEQQHNMREVAETGVRALEFRCTSAHVELVLTAQGPKIIEIGARTGGYRPRMLMLANGVDLFQAQVDAAFGTLPDLTEKYHKYCAVYELFSSKTGEFKGIPYWERVSELASCITAKLKVKHGEKTGLSQDGYRMVALIVLAHAEEATFNKDRAVVEQLTVEVK